MNRVQNKIEVLANSPMDGIEKLMNRLFDLIYRISGHRDIGGSDMDSRNTKLQTATLKSDPDYNAPDGSEIRLLPAMKGGSLCHCTLPVGKISSPVAHIHVEEIWYVIEGEGQIWRKLGALEEITSLFRGNSVTIPPQTCFQYSQYGQGSIVHTHRDHAALVWTG